MSGPGLGQIPGVSRLEARIDSISQSQIGAGNSVGLSIAVVREGKIVLSKQYGLASVANRNPVEAQSEFPIGSVSKQFTAACVLLLVQDGKLSLDDPVGKFFPDLTRAQDIKIRDILNHVSGYSDWYPLDYVDTRLKRKVAAEEVRKLYGTRPLDFEPGAYYSYSNTGYLIAARVVEKVSGQNFYRFLENRILKPLAMTNTHEYRQTGRDIVGRYTSFLGGPVELAELETGGWMLGAGGLLSTPEDLAKWDIALMAGQVVNQDSLREMTKSRILTSGKVSSYGFGLLSNLAFGHKIWEHSGGVSGGTTENLMLPGEHSALIFTSNYDLMPFDQLIHGVMEELIPTESRHATPPARQRVSPPVAALMPPAAELARTIFDQIVSGNLNRSLLTPECSEYLAEAKLIANRSRLKALGEPSSVSLDGTDERGQMEVSSLTFQFKSCQLKFSMYRMKDGRVAEFMVST